MRWDRERFNCYGGKETRKPGEKLSKQVREINYNYLYLTWVLIEARETTRGYTKVVTHPAITPIDWA